MVLLWYLFLSLSFQFSLCCSPHSYPSLSINCTTDLCTSSLAGAPSVSPKPRWASAKFAAQIQPLPGPGVITYIAPACWRSSPGRPPVVLHAQHTQAHAPKVPQTETRLNISNSSSRALREHAGAPNNRRLIYCRLRDLV